MEKTADRTQTGTENLPLFYGKIEHDQAEYIKKQKKWRRYPAEDCIEEKGNQYSDGHTNKNIQSHQSLKNSCGSFMMTAIWSKYRKSK